MWARDVTAASGQVISELTCITSRTNAKAVTTRQSVLMSASVQLFASVGDFNFLKLHEFYIIARNLWRSSKLHLY